ncbi:hypothetical protein QW131_12450 [Roseibium salinum]|nr:hypothetical protein [Roseibium salinum]
MNQMTGADSRMHRRPFKLKLLALVSAIALVPAAAAAETSAGAEALGTPSDLPLTLTGSYLSGRLAGFQKDYAQGAAFFEESLAADPSNPMLLERTFLLKLANGDVEQAVVYADELEKKADCRISWLSWPSARSAWSMANIPRPMKHWQRAGTAPLAQLSIGISRAWALYGSGKVDEAVAMIDGLSGPDWFEVFKATHKAHILFAADRPQQALAAIEDAYEVDQGAIRVVDVYSRLLAANGRQKEALDALIQYEEQFRGHPKLEQTKEIIEGGAVVQPLVTDPAEGMAEILYGLGSVIGRDGGEELSTSYLQLSLYLDPDAEFAAIALGAVFRTHGTARTGDRGAQEGTRRQCPEARSRNPDRPELQFARPDGRGPFAS